MTATPGVTSAHGGEVIQREEQSVGTGQSPYMLYSSPVSHHSTQLGQVGEPGQYLCFLRCIAREGGVAGISGRQRWGRYVYFFGRDSVTFQGFPIAELCLSATCPM